MFGIGLRDCIAKILKGEVAFAQVQKIFTLLDFLDLGEIQRFINECRLNDWRNNPDLGEQLVWELYGRDKIQRYIPAQDGTPSVIGGGCWADCENKIVWLK